MLHSCTLFSQGAPPSSVSGGGSVAEGGVMTVTCVARGAKPAAYIYWNSEPELNLTNTVEEVNNKKRGEKKDRNKRRQGQLGHEKCIRFPLLRCARRCLAAFSLSPLPLPPAFIVMPDNALVPSIYLRSSSYLFAPSPLPYIYTPLGGGRRGSSPTARVYSKALSLYLSSHEPKELT